MNQLNAYERYLMYQYHMAGDFEVALNRLIEVADEDNLDKIAKGFPGEVAAYKMWSRVGRKALYRECGVDFLEDLRKRGCILD